MSNTPLSPDDKVLQSVLRAETPAYGAAPPRSDAAFVRRVQASHRDAQRRRFQWALVPFATAAAAAAVFAVVGTTPTADAPGTGTLAARPLPGGTLMASARTAAPASLAFFLDEDSFFDGFDGFDDDEDAPVARVRALADASPRIDDAGEDAASLDDEVRLLSVDDTTLLALHDALSR